MMELGPRDAEYHQEAGRKAARLGFKMLITVGPLAGLMAEAAIAAGLKQKRVYSFDTAEEAAEAIGPLLRRGDLILVKGSHSVHLEKVVAKIKDVIKET
jgi:UDP-N-acetylmuramoyl-tripeptide--D-alanyl-D-alanine ligase